MRVDLLVDGQAHSILSVCLPIPKERARAERPPRLPPVGLCGGTNSSVMARRCAASGAARHAPVELRRDELLARDPLLICAKRSVPAVGDLGASTDVRCPASELSLSLFPAMSPETLRLRFSCPARTNLGSLDSSVIAQLGSRRAVCVKLSGVSKSAAPTENIFW